MVWIWWRVTAREVTYVELSRSALWRVMLCEAVKSVIQALLPKVTKTGKSNHWEQELVITERIQVELGCLTILLFQYIRNRRWHWIMDRALYSVGFNILLRLYTLMKPFLYSHKQSIYKNKYVYICGSMYIYTWSQGAGRSSDRRKLSCKGLDPPSW